MKIKQQRNMNIQITDLPFSTILWNESRKFSKFEAWIDLQQSINDTHPFIYGRKVINEEKGYTIITLRYLAERWQWSTKKVNNFLSLLVSTKMITKQTSSKGITYIGLFKGNANEYSRLNENETTKTLLSYVNNMENEQSGKQQTEQLEDTKRDNRKTDTLKQQSTSQLTGDYDNVSNCNEMICNICQQTSNKQINKPINRQEQINENSQSGKYPAKSHTSTQSPTQPLTQEATQLNDCNLVNCKDKNSTSNTSSNTTCNTSDHTKGNKNLNTPEKVSENSQNDPSGNTNDYKKETATTTLKLNNNTANEHSGEQQQLQKGNTDDYTKETDLQRNEKETKKAKEVFPPAPPLQEKEINKEKEKKNNVFFPLTSEKCVFNAASGDKNAQSQNEMKNDFEVLRTNEVLKNCEVVDFRFDKQNENGNTQKFENDFSKQNLSSELENKFETSTQNFSTTTHQNEKNDFESQKKIDSLTAEGKFSQNENFSEKEKSCGKKEKEVFNNNHFTQNAVSVESWNVRLRNIKAGLIYSEWLERVAMQLEIPTYQIQTIFESFCCEIEATGEHSTSTTPTAEIQKHFFYWARRKKEKFFEKQKKTNNTAAMLRYYTELEKQMEAKYYGNNQ
jgi:hypothetical protein